MFSDEIIEKITKQYGIKEYGTFINSITYLPVNSKGEKYGTLEFVNYEELEKRMTRAWSLLLIFGWISWSLLYSSLKEPIIHLHLLANLK